MSKASISAWSKGTLLVERAPTSAADELADRIGKVRWLREHHLWEILRTLPLLGEARDDDGFRAGFRKVMARDDLETASRMLLDAARPACRLDCLRFIDGVWVARIVSESAVPRAVAVHPHRISAVMAALVALNRAAPTKH